ncbi:metalloregulator ArsR/SmtB family transcription factor [Gryllotalpicola sp.]|uniref:ArsR/SmtB family transcription factor n=1 Tax=Gryllotalpicola sp. TaxID=1932787 RepID=UPI002601B7C4|nr:metalloregulator ArsR/SmtB family transcription factor [Gryllotalpicola sp.]
MADIFDVVADPTRREILQVLRDSGEVSVSHIVQALELSQPTVSKHLKVLRDAALVTVREEGQHRYYTLDAAPLEELDDWLLPFIGVVEDVESLYRSAGLSEGAKGFAESVGKVAAGAGVRVAGLVDKVKKH